MIYEIKNEQLNVKVSDDGAEVVSLKKAGRELNWQNDNGKWAGHAPILFPVCGNCEIVVDGKHYPVKPHGFARKFRFALVCQNETSVTFALISGDATKEFYPYDFILEVTYELDGNRLNVIYSVTNNSVCDMFFSCGGHESFNLDDDLGNYVVKFAGKETLTQYIHDDDGKLTGETIKIADCREFPLDSSFLSDDRTVILGGIKSGKADLCKKSGEKVFGVEFGGFENLLFWRPGDAKMICIEPWHTLPDTVGKAAPEMKDRDGIIKLARGNAIKITRTIIYY